MSRVVERLVRWTRSARETPTCAALRTALGTPTVIRLESPTIEANGGATGSVRALAGVRGLQEELA